MASRRGTTVMARWWCLVLAVAAALAVPAAPATAAPELCGQFDSTRVDEGRAVVQNNRWGAGTAQCIDVQGRGFTITRADHDNSTSGAPAGYPSVFEGCHYAICTADSGLPLQVSAFGDLRSSVAVSVPPSGGEYNVAYDLWFDPTRRTDGQNTGAELMIWLDRRGRPQPVGSRVGSATIAGATWDVWVGNIGWNVISFVRTTGTSAVRDLDLDLTAFTREAVRRGQISPSWYLTSVQFGFEPWVGGAGLAARDFTFTTSGSAPAPGPAPAPTPSPRPQPTAPAPQGRTGRIVGLAGRCLDVAGARSADGTPIIIWDCHGGANQRWTVTPGGSISSLGRCLATEGGGTANGTRVVLRGCDGSATQRWEAQPNGNLRNAGSGKVLDVAGYEGRPGTPTQIWDANGWTTQANQVWRLP